MSPAGKPLFDLMPNARQSTPRADGPRPRPEREPRAERARAQHLSIQTYWLYVAAAAVLVLVLFGYGLGYRIGAAAERDAMQALVQDDPARALVQDPLSPDSPPTQPPPNAARPAGDRTTAPAGTEILTPEGVVSIDPRIVGSNYLELATLNRAQADDAVRYLAANGERAIAVPALDRGRASRNTSDRFRVVALGLVVPGERYRTSAREREAFERRIARLGKAWAEQGGASDFSDPLWRRHGG